MSDYQRLFDDVDGKGNGGYSHPQRLVSEDLKEEIRKKKTASALEKGERTFKRSATPSLKGQCECCKLWCSHSFGCSYCCCNDCLFGTCLAARITLPYFEFQVYEQEPRKFSTRIGMPSHCTWWDWTLGMCGGIIMIPCCIPRTFPMSYGELLLVRESNGVVNAEVHAARCGGWGCCFPSKIYTFENVSRMSAAEKVTGTYESGGSSWGMGLFLETQDLKKYRLTGDLSVGEDRTPLGLKRRKTVVHSFVKMINQWIQ